MAKLLFDLNAEELPPYHERWNGITINQRLAYDVHPGSVLMEKSTPIISDKSGSDNIATMTWLQKKTNKLQKIS